jgi:hypothetical protein
MGQLNNNGGGSGGRAQGQWRVACGDVELGVGGYRDMVMVITGHRRRSRGAVVNR